MSTARVLSFKPRLRASKTQPSDELLTEALEQLRRGNTDEAERLCMRILAVNLHDAETLFVFALAHVQSGQLQMADRILRRAIAADPRQPQYLSMRGTVLHALGNNDEAVACFETALRLKPDDAETWCKLGNVSTGMSNPADPASVR